MIAVAVLSGWAIYHTACFLVEGMGNLGSEGQQQFNGTLLQYLLMFSVTIIVVGGSLHFYFTKKMIKPIRQIIESTKLAKKGHYPDPIKIHSKDEIGILVQHYNDLIFQLQKNELNRHKFVSNLSHEFRTPLSNLKGYLDALKSGVIEGDERLYLALYEEAKRLTLMIGQLEQLKEWDDIQSQTMLEKQNVDIANLINQSVAMFEWRLSEANIPYSVNVISKEMLIQVEGIQQVISNLLDNAIQYYNGDGKISIKGEILNDVYHISIMGPSHPIPDAEVDNIFDRFYRLDHSRSRETGGSGLGLAIAKEIVEKHKGKIGVKNINPTNMFWLTIPILEN